MTENPHNLRKAPMCENCRFYNDEFFSMLPPCGGQWHANNWSIEPTDICDLYEEKTE